MMEPAPVMSKTYFLPKNVSILVIFKDVLYPFEARFDLSILSNVTYVSYEDSQ